MPGEATKDFLFAHRSPQALAIRRAQNNTRPMWRNSDRARAENTLGFAPFAVRRREQIPNRLENTLENRACRSSGGARLLKRVTTAASVRPASDAQACPELQAPLRARDRSLRSVDRSGVASSL